MLCLHHIKEELKEKKIEIYYSSTVNLPDKNKKIIIAIEENNLYPLLTSIGCIREKAKIKSYTLSCSNCLIRWENSMGDIADRLTKYAKRITLLCETGRYGAVICESEIKQKILARICDKGNVF